MTKRGFKLLSIQKERQEALLDAGPRSGGALDARVFLRTRLALPVPEVAKLLGISSAAVRLMIHRGDLPGKKVGGGSERITYIIPTGALLAWLDGMAVVASEGAA